MLDRPKSARGSESPKNLQGMLLGRKQQESHPEVILLLTLTLPSAHTCQRILVSIASGAMADQDDKLLAIARPARPGESPQALTLSKAQTKGLFVYLGAMLIACLAATGVVLAVGSNPGGDPWTVLGAVGMAGLGSSIYYIRKLYKELISNTMDFTSPQDLDMRRLGVLAYFASRPLFAFAFAMLVYVLCKGGISASVSGAPQTGPGFQYIVMTLSFFAGFLSGKVIGQLEEYSFSMLPKLPQGGNDAKNT